MAEMISAQRAAELSHHGIGPRTNYPWPKWENGAWWHLIEGEDFHTSKKSMVTVIHTRAQRQGKTAEVRRCEDGVIFRFVAGRTIDVES